MKKIYVVYQKPIRGQVSVLFATFSKEIARQFVNERIGPENISLYWVEEVELRE